VHRFINQLLDVPSTDPDDARRRKLLNILLLGIGVTGCIGLVVSVLADIIEPAKADYMLTSAILGLLIGHVIIFFINRYGPGWLASGLFLLLMVVIVTVCDYPQEIADGRTSLGYVFPIMMGSILWPPYGSFVVAGLSSLAFIGVALSIGWVPNPFIIFTYFLFALVAWLSARTMERALRDLRALNVELDQRVQDRTRELAEANERLQEANEHLQELDEQRARFLNIAAHDLRNPLAGIQSLLQLVQEKRGTQEQLDEYLQMALGEVHRLGRLLNDLLDLSRLGAGMVTLDLKPLQLTEMVRSALVGQRPVIEERKHTVQLAVPDDLPPVEADPDRLLQILDNLIGNAAKYTSEGGTITIFAERHDQEVWTTVRDTGIGIPEAELDSIFQPFQRASTTRHDGLGAGLGLSITRQLVERHGGRIWVESEPGQGSTFTFSLPIASPAPLVSQQAAAARHRILVVDDDLNIQEIFRRALEPEGHEVRLAEDGESALRMAKEASPNVIILDLLLPKMTGDEVLKRIRQDPATADIPVIITSIISLDDELHPLVSAFLPKPVELAELTATVKEVATPEPTAKILVVDDNRGVRVALSEALTQAGYAVLLAENGNTGLEIIRKHSPDVVVLDVLLPDITGWEILRWLKAEGVSLPVIVISGVVGANGRTQALQLGAAEFHQKPLDLKMLQESITELVSAVLRRRK
jgi:signal transduction histidine kinase/CheY-like chemotaxis protein